MSKAQKSGGEDLRGEYTAGADNFGKSFFESLKNHYFPKNRNHPKNAGSPPHEEEEESGRIFSKSSEESINFVEYRLFDRKNRHGDNLEQLANEMMNFSNQFILDFIWNIDPFQLNALPTQEKDFPAHIYGKTYFGENIDDEFFIVFLIFEITKKFRDFVAT